MSVLEAAASEAVTDLLRAIEDKLHETGMLVSATGDSEADVTIAFRQVTWGSETVVAMTMQVSTTRAFGPAGRNWAPLRHYVLARFASLENGLPEHVRECLLDCPGPLVFINGAIVN